MAFFVYVTIRFVGVDAHIDPAGCTIFTKILGEFVRAQWVDVGIAPTQFQGRSHIFRETFATSARYFLIESSSISSAGRSWL